MTTKFARFRLYESVVFIGILILLIGCRTAYKKIEPNLLISVESKDKIPLRAGLYLDRRLINFSKGPGSAEIAYIEGKIDMGEALSRGAEVLAKKSFKEVVVVYTMESRSLPKELDVLVFPEIDKIYGGYHAEMISAFQAYPEVVVRIKWNIMDVNNNLRTLYMNTFTGEAKYRRQPAATSFSRLCEAYTKAIEDQFSKAYIGISSTNWWKSIEKNVD
jgi:hypothetical protein